jgi:hypothetical protein
MNKKFHIVTKELLEELEKRFPDRCPEPDLSLDEIRFKQGQVSVVRFLRAHHEAQSKNVLEK